MDTLQSLKVDIKEDIRNLVSVTSYNYEKLDDKLDKISGTMYRMSEKEISQDKAISGLEHAIYGNGKPGLKAEVQDIASQIKNLDSDITELKHEVTTGFRNLSNRQRDDDVEKKENEKSVRETRVKLAIALITAAGVGGSVLKIIEALMGV